MKDYEKLRAEMIRDKVRKAVAENPGNVRESLEDIGFTWFDDEYPSEEDEEKVAVPEIDRQWQLVSYFEGQAPLSAAVITAFLNEHEAEESNYPLIRRYFRAANQPLKKLILAGLENDPTNLALLTDLIFFHEFERNLSELITHLTRACRLEDDPQRFSEIAREFHDTTQADGYHALAALQEIFAEGSDKRTIIDYLIAEAAGNDQEEMEF
ncbi:MAG: hypothetical protein KKG47_03770 [Proteobacteria bacterium]|nr:hypothetical protein [Pseudomonadota bacterium]MBU1738065.1 hypothetical protein [Pseudomonadota bacterium]